LAEETGQERTEEATPKRKQDARKKGDIPRSKDLTTMMMLMAAAVSIMTLGPGMVNGITGVMKSFFLRAADTHIAARELPAIFLTAIDHIVLSMLPFVIVMVLVAIVSPMLMSGWNFSIEAIKFKGDKLNPISGIKRVFGVNGVIEMVKTVLKFLVIAVFAVFLIWHQLPEILSIGRGDIMSSLKHAAELVSWTFLLVSATTILIVAVDVPQQLWQYSKKLKMTREQVKQEHKDTEGMPEVKSRLRQKQQEMAQRRMMEEVPKADVIVTNPTHFSVALKYDSENMGAPKVVAKGADEIAFRIREVARANNVPILETPPLARALYYSTKVNQEIPAGLYKAVAQVLAYVFQLRTNPRATEIRSIPEDLPIPDEFKR